MPRSGRGAADLEACGADLLVLAEARAAAEVGVTTSACRRQVPGRPVAGEEIIRRLAAEWHSVDTAFS
jgi:hypothetical protein